MRFLSTISIFILVLFYFGCKKEYANGFRIYKIKKGHHRSTSELKSLIKDTLTFEAIFNESAKYTSIDPKNQRDINKLYGFSDCNQHHQKNSARFGWRWFNNNLEIHAYVYNNGVWSSKLIDTIEFNKAYKYSIELYYNNYVFRLNNKSVQMERTAECYKGLYYILYPYFGGDETASHDIEIHIKDYSSR